ncbi:MAG: chitobiase/beta-hexosaminidase C-terminal domain-containing protein [Bacteroidales bacterium]
MLHSVLTLLLTGITTSATGINYRQDFSGFTFETGTRITSFGQQGEWTVSANGNAETRLDYKGDWGSGTAAGFRGNDLVLGYQHTTTTGELKITLTLPNLTDEYIGLVNIAYTGRVMRPTMGRSPVWKVTVNGQVISDLSYSTAEAEDADRNAPVQVNVAAGENLVIQWSCDNGEGSGYSRQIGIAGVEVIAGQATQAAAPAFNPPPGAFDAPVEVQITAPTPGSMIFYTLNGSSPTPADNHYEGDAVSLEKSTTLRAVAFHEELQASAITTGIYSIAEQSIAITGVEDPEGLTVDQGTPFEDLELPLQVFTHFESAASCSLSVDWLKGEYNGGVAAAYTLTGNLRPQEGIINPSNIQPRIMVTVQEVIVTYSVTFELLLESSLGYDPQQDKVFITGSMFEWAVPGTMPEQQMMEHQGALNFSKTMELEPGSYNYRYYFNAGISHPEAGPERNILVEGSMQVTDLWGSTPVHIVEDDALTAYPNPASSFIILEAAVPIDSMIIYGIHGDKYFDLRPGQRQVTLNASAMPCGLYLACVVMNRHVQVIKIRICR